MPATVGKLPRGLVALLSLRDSGEAPRLLADTIVGTVQMQELFLLQDREVSTGPTNAAPAVGANFFTPSVVVPAGQLWYVWEYFVASSPGAGAAIDMAAAAVLDGLSLMMPLGDYASAAATQNVRCRADHPFWAGPGTEFGFTVRSVTLAPSVAVGLIFTRIRI